MTETPNRGRRPAVGEPVLDRAFRLLDAFSEERPLLRLSELAVRADVPISTALRLAQRLTRLGALERQADGRFAVGLKMLEYAALAPRGHGLRSAALPYMEDLHRATGQHVQLAVREKGEGVIVERLSAAHAGRVLYHVGGRFPLHGTGLGLVLLAHAREEFRTAYLSRPLVLQPEGADVDVVELRERLGDIRASGRATFSRPMPEPAKTVAAPVFGADGDCVAALSVVGADALVDMRMIEPAVVAIARAVSRELVRGDVGRNT
ncbi:IclR family transcriptional regulator [Microbacterium sp. AGC85]